MSEPDELVQELRKLLEEQRALLAGRLTEQAALHCKELEIEIRELFQLLADGKSRGE